VPLEEPPILPDLSGVLPTRRATISTAKVLLEESQKEPVLLATLASSTLNNKVSKT